jgi:uncharacterized repeat protein (TIGR03803 family)
MKTCIKTSFVAAVLCSLLSTQLPAQTFTVLHRFAGGASANPVGTLVGVSNRLYGTTSAFWGSRDGTVFAVNTDGTAFETLHTFSTLTSDPDSNAYTNSDGAVPLAGLILSGNTLYGTTYKGGSLGQGTVFALNTDGTGFRILHDFNDYDGGANPWAPLLLSGNTLYGTASVGGYWGCGTLFALNTNGTGFAVLHLFTCGEDGVAPMGGLILSGNTLYGTANNGGTSSVGAVFKVITNGTGFTNLHIFSGIDGSNPGNSGLTLSGNTLYGTTFLGGTTFSGAPPGYGTVFKLQTDGSGFTNLYSFSPAPNGTNSDGDHPTYGVIFSGNTLYGTAGGGFGGSGTVFAMDTNRMGLTTLHYFAALSSAQEPSTNTDGSGLQSGLLLSDNILYGITIAGGSGYGTLFSISMPPMLTITAAGKNVILMWPTNVPGVTLQCTTNLSPSAVWINLSAPAVVVNGQNAATNPISGTRQFYRLSRRQD